ncbi:neuropeptide F receptor-like [Teleopsis dalmanni]|uniref:neuropeptide F receptor-like n=1 Tax=Teleopsis dalmanni TaxID=139649 RepID=UPI0018CDB36C|nr:neuropeptide F receptor-like [Teleopsis dalmanni]
MNHSITPFSLTSSSVELLTPYVSNSADQSKELEIDYLDGSTNMSGATSNDTPHLDPVLLERFTKNRSIDEPWYHILIAMYSVLIVFGAVGNVLVVVAVVRKPIMRTARNLFILNLAISDLLLCLVTMPLTLMEILSKFWPFGSYAVLCKMIAMLQALSIFVSTISITAIAFDRYQVNST